MVIEDDIINVSNETLCLTDINILAYFISKSYITMNWTLIDLSDCGIDDGNCKILQHGLNLNDGRDKPNIQHLKTVPATE